jgi:hypothetical protein
MAPVQQVIVPPSPQVDIDAYILKYVSHRSIGYFPSSTLIQVQLIPFGYLSYLCLLFQRYNI